MSYLNTLARTRKAARQVGGQDGPSQKPPNLLLYIVVQESVEGIGYPNIIGD
jgi:hypothetical protein